MGIFHHMNEKKKLPELYTEQQMNCLEMFIEEHFGAYESVFHELVSPDIHVDIAILPPTPERNCYTLITMGMGAHRMRVPRELKKKRLDRAELLICLPPDWQIQSSDERWYWPIRWLKILARLPGNENTWLGWGHTVPCGEPLADNTRLSGLLLEDPAAFGGEAAVCPLPDGSQVHFYQVIPLYEEEMDFKVANDTQTLRGLFGGAFPPVLDIRRPNEALEARALSS